MANERYSNKQVKQRYFDRRPDIVKIFDDLDAYRDFCRIELLPFNEADLYNKHAKTWQIYERNTGRPRKPWNGEKKQWNNNRNNNNSQRVAKPRSH
jgi:hypothetical protein